MSMSTHNEDNSHPFDSPTDHRSILSIIGWVLGAMTAVVVACRLVIRSKISQGIALDDVFIVISLVLALCQTGVLSTAVNHGFGLLDGTRLSQLEVQQKAIYAFNILFICSQVFAKISIVFFIRLLTPVRWHRRLCVAIVVITVLWGVIAIFALALQCQLPQPWQGAGSRCVNRLALLGFVEAFNIMLDIALIAFPTVIIWRLQQRTKRKALIIATFFSRLGVIAATIIQIVVTFHPQGKEALDNPFLSWTYALTTQVVEYLSIVSACGPYLKPLLESLSSGMIGNDDIARRAASYSQRWSRNRFLSRYRHQVSSGQLRKLQPGAGVYEARVTATQDVDGAVSAHNSDYLGQKRTPGSIRVSTSYQVTHECADS